MGQARYYYSFASGSTGNCGVYVEDGAAVIIDLGISFRRLSQGLKSLGLKTTDIKGALITHEHTDHVKGLKRFLSQTEVPIFASKGTILALERKCGIEPDTLEEVCDGSAFSLGDIRVTPFDTPHDAEESLGFTLESPDFKFGFATDMGFVPGSVKNHLLGCGAVVLESNYDPVMLQMGPYPYPLKQRVSGPGGHLSNPDCALCAAELARNGTDSLILAHLSVHNNMPELALRQTLNAINTFEKCEVHVAPKDSMNSPIKLEEHKPCFLYV